MDTQKNIAQIVCNYNRGRIVTMNTTKVDMTNSITCLNYTHVFE